ncbi:hypothetical protein, partial [Pseudomonas fluorescens]|uniref:hypothetical protein n=1 Tax=Pseudomonas fluorescens TaxID=294 RepID=UPI001BB1B688
RALVRNKALVECKSAQEVAQYCATSCALGCRPCATWLSAVLSDFFAKQVRNFLRTVARCLHLVEMAISGLSDQKIAAFGSSCIWNAFPL